MKTLFHLIDRLSWGILIIFCATLGLAAFSPPHIEVDIYLKGLRAPATKCVAGATLMGLVL